LFGRDLSTNSPVFMHFSSSYALHNLPHNELISVEYKPKNHEQLDGMKIDTNLLIPHVLYMKLCFYKHNGGVAHMVERSLRMREARGSIPRTSMFIFVFFPTRIKFSRYAPVLLFKNELTCYSPCF
jgi:hypothetical protein